MIKELNIMDLYDNLINNKKININTLYLCIFLTEEIYSKYGVFFMPG
mgnify:CR=1 FL=1